MKDIISKQLNTNKHFIFKSKESKPVAHLRDVSKNVPDTDGNYYVFANSNVDTPEHLKFSLQDSDYELYYFGIAGGISKNGKIGKQKLKGRINNVVGKPSIKRAKYWDHEMLKYDIAKLDVYYFENPKPKDTEDYLYLYLNKNVLTYPKLNKKRGRPKK